MGEKLLFNTQGTGHSGAPEAAVPVGVLAQVLLVVILRVVKGLSLPDVRGDQAETMLRQNLWRERRHQDQMPGSWEGGGAGSDGKGRHVAAGRSG